MADQRTLTVLGATGSIGTSTLDLVRRYPDRFRITALTAGRDSVALAELALEFRPDHVAVADMAAFDDLRQRLSGSGIEVHGGEEAVADLAALEADITVSAITGMAGLMPTMAAVRRGGTIAIANKEAVVTAGSFLLAEARQSGATILPVDSEHNAIFQAWADADHASIEKITLTASGGPFWDHSREAMASVTPDQALRHPNWSMGAKISIDSATMMNKGLEVIEAAVLFDLPEDRIDVLVHRQSVIHGMVHYRDGSCLAQLGAADMRVPIAHVLGWPERLNWQPPSLDLAKIATLDFEAPDHHRFPCLELSRAASRQGGLAPAALNAANEKAVAFFLDGAIGFLDIDGLNAHIMNGHDHPPVDGLASVFDHDRMIRSACDAWLSSR
ncbi:MAG: 1-deoxy-D-xylulose-5-phosphate reductoisomerase [Candidatus Puniceispirillales bacterium]